MRFKLQVACAVIAVITGGSLDHRLVFAHDHDIVERDENAHGREDGHGRADVAVEIVIGAEGYQLRREGQPVGPDVSLIAGRPTIFAIRNEDSVAHDFISALFTRIEVHFTGRATGIFRKEAAGFRLKPGDSLTLQFIPPFSEFRSMYDLIWCSHHTQHSPQRKELLIVVTEDKQPGS